MILCHTLCLRMNSSVCLWFFHMISLIFSCWTFRGVSGDGSGVTVEGSIPVADETIATPPPADTKASILLNSIRDFKMCIYWVCERMDVI